VEKKKKSYVDIYKTGKNWMSDKKLKKENIADVENKIKNRMSIFIREKTWDEIREYVLNKRKKKCIS